MILEVARGDERLEPYRHVGDHHWLRGRQLFLAEGRLVFERLAASGAHRIRSVLVTPGAAAALERILAAIDAPVYVASPDLLTEITGYDFHRGCLALAERPEAFPPDVPPGARLVLALEGIGNPDNVGGLFRTAAAFGVDLVLLDEASGDPLYRKAVRTSMGAVLEMPFARVPDLPATIAALRSEGFTVVALTPDGSAATLDDFVSAATLDRVLLMLGAEGSGLSPDALAAATARVRIETTSRVDSLNVAVAAGIALSRVAQRP